MIEITWIQALLVAVTAYLATSVWVFGVGYFTLYRPLIGGTIVGLILGDVRQGMAFGAALNAVHLGFVSTGGSLPSDLVTAGYMGTALALASGLDVEAALAAFGIPLGILGGFLWFARMTVGSAFVHWADARAAALEEPPLTPRGGRRGARSAPRGVRLELDRPGRPCAHRVRGRSPCPHWCRAGGRLVEWDGGPAARLGRTRSRAG